MCELIEVIPGSDGLSVHVAPGTGCWHGKYVCTLWDDDAREFMGVTHVYATLEAARSWAARVLR